MTNTPSHRSPTLWVYLAAGLSYFAVVRLGLWSTTGTEKIAPVWLGTGLAIWLTIRFGPRILIALAVGESAANWLNNFPKAGSLAPLVLAIMIFGNIFAAYVGAALWEYGCAKWSDRLDDFREPLVCAIAALVAPIFAATVGVGALVVLGGEPLAMAFGLWWAWWIGDAIGALYLLPLLLATPVLGHRLRQVTARDGRRGALLLGLAVVAVGVIFGKLDTGPYLFLLFPPLVLAAAWFEAAGTRVLGFLIASAGTSAAAFGYGPFTTGHAREDLLSVQLFLGAGGLIALFLPAVQARQNLLRPLPLTLLLGGWMISGLVVGKMSADLRSRDAADLGQLAFNAEASIESRIVNYVSVLRSAQSFVLGSQTVNRKDWQNFVRSLDVPVGYPGLHGIGLVYPVRPEETEAFLARVRADGAPDFALHPLQGETLSGAQPHFILTQMEFFGPHVEQPLGLDVGSAPLHRSTLEAARDTGQPQITQRINVTQVDSGFLLYLPVYAGGTPVTTVAERRAALRAWVHAPFITNVVMEGVLGSRRNKLRFYLFSAGPLDAAHLLYSTAPGGALPKFELTHPRRLFGQDFTLAWTRGPAFATESRVPLILLAVTFAVGTVLLTGWVLSLQSFRERAEEVATRRTQALSESEARYRSLVEWSPNPLAIHRDGRVLYVNPAGIKLFGATTAADIVGKSIADLIHPDSRVLVQSRLQSMNAAGDATPPAFARLLRLDGTAIEVEVRSVTFPYEGELAIYSTAEDVTARIQAKAALRASEERFRSLIEYLPVGVLRQGPNAEILLCNPRALELLDLSADQLLGKTSLDPSWNVIHEDGSPFPGPSHPVPLALATHRPVMGVVMGVYRPTKKDRVWLHVDAKPELTETGAVREVICTFSDITARRQAEEKVREQLNELERWHAAMLGREERVQELKREINAVLTAAGQPARYASAEEPE